MVLAMVGSSLLVGTAAAEGDPVAGEKVFKRCATCHMVGPNAKKRIGPVLNDLFGRKAGTNEDFKYSPVMTALGEAGLVWNPEDFAGYVGDPRDWLTKKAKEMGLDCSKLRNCRNTMAFAGLKKQEDIDDVVAFLLTHDKDGLAKQ
ncbi:MAG: c-type cytochrome [Alphaproteobacteria bacterium]|nr:c-type cytochrome [Alphaproteobacteria bacterium]